MSLPRFLLDDGSLASAVSGSALELRGDEGRHASGVRRIRVGECVDLTDGAGTVAHCVVTAVDRAGLGLTVDAVSLVPAPALRFGLVQALAKGGRDEQAVETATEVGVDVVLPWQAERSISRWDGPKAEKGLARWTAIVREAAKQSRRSWLPVVEPARTTSGLGGRLGATTLALVLHEEATEALVDVGLPPAGEVLLIVGPEGGIGHSELGSLVEAGARPVRMGPEVMRTSSAGPVALGWLAAASGRWSALS